MVETSEFSAALDEVYLKRGWSPPDTPSTTSALAQAKAALEAAHQHGASTFYGADGEKNRRASWRGVMRLTKSALEAIRKAGV